MILQHSRDEQPLGQDVGVEELLDETERSSREVEREAAEARAATPEQTDLYDDDTEESSP